ncbi:MAG TPA: hypothetical protein EYH05_12245 [Anaerolineae bacterium]|nr:hypothetical protein [Anaerolineae bacterium]
MSLKTYLQQTSGVLRQHPYLWAIALIAVLGDVVAVVTHSPFTARLHIWTLLFVLITIVAEAALIYAYLQYYTGKEAGFVDALMTAVTYIPQLLAAKILPLVLLGVYTLFLMVVAPQLVTAFADNVGVAVFILLLITLPVLVVVQTWAFFIVCVLFTSESSIAEVISAAWYMAWRHKWHLLKIALPFLLLDLALIAVLFSVNAITYDSIFTRIVTPDMADSGDLLTGEGSTAAGVMFTMSRFLNSFWVMIFKTRGIEVASIPLFITDQMMAGLTAVFAGLVLLIFRIGVFAAAFLQFPESEPISHDVLHVDYKETV